MTRLLAILAPARSQWPWLAGGILLGVAVLTANMLLMAVSGWFISSMAVAGAAKLPFNFFYPSAAIRLLAIMRTVGRYGERLVTHEAAFRVLSHLRAWLFRRMIPLAPAGLERYAGADLAGRLRADLDSLENLYLRIIAPFCSGLAAIMLAGLFAGWFHAASGAILAGLLLVAGLLLPLVVRRLAEQPGRRSVELAAELRSRVGQGLQGAEELLLLGADQAQASEVEALSGRLIAEQVRLGQLGGLTMAVTTLLAGVTLALLGSVLVPAVESVQLSGPQMVMLLLFAAAAFEAVGPLAHSLSLIPASRQAVERIRELSDAAPPLPEPLVSPEISGHALVLQAVHCGYGDAGPVLNGLSLKLAEGERLAVTGPSGCGKSTLLELVLRLRPYQGSITLGGVELRELSMDTVSAIVAALPQQPHLFNDTIRQNILMGREVSDTELDQLLHDCCLDEWVAGLPGGLETAVGCGGSAVSGGEARRIALARALAGGAPVLLLDEPTEGLDSLTEQRLIERLQERVAGATLLVVTHRPAALALAQRVVRLEALQQ